MLHRALIHLLLGLSFSSAGFAANSKDLKEETELYHQALKSIQSEDWEEGLLRMEHFVHYFGKSKLAGNAIFWMAQVYLQKNEKALARDELLRLLRDYPSSSRAKQAKELLVKIQADTQTGRSHENL